MTEGAGNHRDIEKFIRLEKEVLVLGGGISGIVLSEALVRAGMHVTIVEKANNIGCGNRSFLLPAQEKATKELIKGKISFIAASENVTLITGGELTGLNGHFGGFEAIIKKNDGQLIRLKPSILAAATGYRTERYDCGLPDGGNVCYLSDLVASVSDAHDNRLLWNGRPVSNVVYVLDLVNDDIKLDSIAALNQALTLRTTFGCEVSVLCKDLKVSFTGGELLYLKAREEGVLFFKYDRPPEFLMSDNMVSLELPGNRTYGDIMSEKVIPDLIVLPETSLPGSDTERICRILGIDVEGGGYMMDDNPQFLRIRSNRRGIYVVGACRYPQDIYETFSEAEAAAQEIVALLRTGIYELDEVRAEVDADKCALCYTCPRLCPHHAIKIEKYAEQNIYRTFNQAGNILFNAARVEPAACYGCGICVAECPARAITLYGEKLSNQLSARM